MRVRWSIPLPVTALTACTRGRLPAVQKIAELEAAPVTIKFHFAHEEIWKLGEKLKKFNFTDLCGSYETERTAPYNIDACNQKIW